MDVGDRCRDRASALSYGEFAFRYNARKMNKGLSQFLDRLTEGQLVWRNAGSSVLQSEHFPQGGPHSLKVTTRERAVLMINAGSIDCFEHSLNLRRLG